MYTEQQEALRSALWNFIGAILSSSNYEGDKGKETVIALMSEELAKLCKDEDDKVNMKIAKPILRNTEWLLNNRANDMIVASVDDNTSEQTRKSLECAADEVSKLSNALKNYTDKL